MKPTVHVLETWGDFACYTSPLTKAERFSYACPTPSAVRGVFDAIYVDPRAFRWQIVRVDILNPIRYISFRRNEVKEKVSVANVRKWMSGKSPFEPMLADGSPSLTGGAHRGRTQRQTMALRDVRYRFHATIVPWNDSPNERLRYDALFRRRAARGKCVFQPCLGLREFPCFFRLAHPHEHNVPPENMDAELGWIALRRVRPLSAGNKKTTPLPSASFMPSSAEGRSTSPHMKTRPSANMYSREGKVLRQLAEYSARRRLPGLGFAPKLVKWAVLLDSQGRFREIVELGNPQSPRNVGREFAACPDLSQAELVAGKEKRSHFLVDSIATVLGWDGRAKREPSQEEKREFFIFLLSQAAGACPEAGLFADFLGDLEACRTAVEDLRRRGAKPTDKITVMYRDHEPRFPLDDDAWHDWWSRYRKSLGKQPRKRSESRMVSFISGEAVEPARTHPKITGLGDVGAAKTGAAVVSCDKDALCSYGLTQSLNSAMSEEEAAAYRAGLNHLLANHGHRVASHENRLCLRRTDSGHGQSDAIDPESDRRPLRRRVRAGNTGGSRPHAPRCNSGGRTPDARYRNRRAARSPRKPLFFRGAVREFRSRGHS